MRQGLVLMNGRENTEDQTGQNYQKSAENEREHILILIKRFYKVLQQSSYIAPSFFITSNCILLAKWIITINQFYFP